MKTCPICGEDFEPKTDEDFCEVCTLEAAIDAMHYGG